MEAQPLIAVRDVEASSLWYQKVLGCESGHGGKEYERILYRGKLILQIHAWDAHDHPLMGDPAHRLRGNGTLLWFATEDLDGAVARAREVSAVVLDGPRFNESAQHREIWLRDIDGYVVVIAGV